MLMRRRGIERECISAKELKKKLSWLKKHQGEGEQKIHSVSKLIRSKLKGQSNEIRSENIKTQLHKKFWKTCEKLFKPAENILPKFTVEICVKYFNFIGQLSKLRKQNFSIFPDWMLKLPVTSIHQFNSQSIHSPSIHSTINPPTHTPIHP